MALYKSLVYREFRLSRSYYILITLLFVLFETLVLIGMRVGIALEGGLDNDAEEGISILITSIVPAIGGFLSARDANNYKKDVISGWASYARVLPATAKQRALACILLRLGFSAFLCLLTFVWAILVRTAADLSSAVPNISMFLAAMALTVLLDSVYSAVVMRTRDKKAFKKVALIAAVAVIGTIELISKLIGRGENGELLDDGLLDKLKEPAASQKIFNFLTSYTFLAISACALIAAFIVYFITVSKSLERREA
ncbi:MAG: hypothetical protein IJM32_08280 [Ruminococcus sp.]|nr:hypothetical protein [Ruminococcus sp.]